MATLLGQHCTVFLDDTGIQRFRILSSIDAVLPGDLPLYGDPPYTSQIFVHKIVSTTDPKSDTFLRVANVADLTTLPQGRELAVGLGQTLYMSTEFTVEYDDIATASQAKLLIQQRVDNLIADWHAYNDQFLAPLNAPVTPPQTYSEITLPLTTSIVSERQDAYNTAHAEYLAAKGESETAAATVISANAAASAANEDAANAVTESQKCSSMLGQFNTGMSALEKLIASVTTLVTQTQVFVNSSTAFYNADVAFSTEAQTYIGYGTAATAPQNTAFGGAKTTWDSALSTWYTAYQTNNAMLSSSFAAACATFYSQCLTFQGQSATYIGYGANPSAGQVSTYTTQKNTWAGQLATWYGAYQGWSAYVLSTAADLAAYNANGGSVFEGLHTSMATACTSKIADVGIAASKKTDADKAAAEATTAKKAADEAASAALIADTTAFLAYKEVCPTAERTVP